MNLLARAKLSPHLIFFSPSPKRPIFYLHPLTALQQFNFYSTKTTLTRQSTKPRTQKSSESSSSFAQRIKKQSEALNYVWPKPQQIPYQAEVANFVNLIGYVKMPVLFEAASDGKHFATTVISIRNVGESNLLSIPVVFEGDLAHVVACHVKENDAVFVSGRLSAVPIRLVMSESLGKFHLVAENLNLVDEFEKNPVERVDNDVDFNKQLNDVIRSAKTKDESSPSVGNYVRPSMIADAEPEPEAKLYQKSGESVGKKPSVGNYVKPSMIADAEPEPEAKPYQKSGESVSKKPSVGNYVNPSMIADAEPEPEAKPYQKSGESVSKKPSVGNYVNPSMIADAEPEPEAKPYQKSGESVGQKKDGDQILDLWRDLVKNPRQWWDYRNHKSKGLVKERFPDFKQKGTGESLWISTAPKWVLPGIGRLEFDVKDVKPTAVLGGGGMKKFGKNDDSWKNLVENPDKWYDNRAKKRNPKAPDFKHKETGEALWVDKLPAWVLSRLPPIKDGQNTILRGS
ncbi:hypothetical protein BUALT_Bualt09G0072200 [Buddleja alternifolia]|uniref:Uncharacterized protein n=1 Tax=Buddleja alternifolia TaxID=168488 RepID=A0AAV6XBG6_9LAMI|nr:hypothetical protein BUALT_Bualt09G0072200 [Buddleja alternifolia]